MKGFYVDTYVELTQAESNTFKKFNLQGWMEVCFSPSPSSAVVCNSDTMTALNSSVINIRTPQKGGGSDWALYGILQLPNRLACSDDTSSVPNICHRSCNSGFRHFN